MVETENLNLNPELPRISGTDWKDILEPALTFDVNKYYGSEK